MTRRDFDWPQNGRFLPLFLILIPLLLSWVWGPYFADETYSVYRFAQNLAAGRGLTYDLEIMPSLAIHAPPVSPLFIGILALLAAAMTPAGLFLSGLGWGGAALVVFRVGGGMKRPFPALIAPFLITFIPILPLSLGSATPWAVALGWTAIYYNTTKSDSQNRHIWVWFALLLLGVHFDISTLVLVIFLLGNQWRRSRQLPRAPILLLLGFVVSWVWFVSGHWEMAGMIRPFSPNEPLIQLLRSHELLWLFFPFALLGGWAVWTNREETRVVQWILLWTVLVWLVGSALVGAVTAVTALFLTGLGIEWLINQLRPKYLPEVATEGRMNLWEIISLLLIIPLLFIQLITLWQQYQARPTAQFALETNLAVWLRTHSLPDAALFAVPRIGYLAQRAALPATEPSSQLVQALAAEPDYLVSAQTLDWNEITRSGWFRERYVPIRRYRSDYAPFAPLTIWEHTNTPFDNGQLEPISVILPNKIEMVGYKFEPTVIQPGDDVYLTVYLQATQPITVGFHTQANLAYLHDEWVWAWQRQLTPQSVAGHAWQPGQILPERFKLETEATIPYGAYKLQVLWHWANDGLLWPVYRNNDENVLDRVLMGYVAVPPPVDATQAIPVAVRFGDQITLAGYETLGETVPGATVEIALYWQALRPPDDDYFVFVHLLDETGQFVASHDGRPMDGRFDTRAWQPDMTIPDSHPLTLPPDLPPGRYQVMVGLYQRETGARLPVWAADGIEQANGSWPLTVFHVP